MRVALQRPGCYTCADCGYTWSAVVRPLDAALRYEYREPCPRCFPSSEVTPEQVDELEASLREARALVDAQERLVAELREMVRLSRSVHPDRDAVTPVAAADVTVCEGPFMKKGGTQALGDVQPQLSALAGELARRARAVEGHQLIKVTVNAARGMALADLLGGWRESATGGWLVTERTSDAREHCHGLVLARSVTDVEALIRDTVTEHGLSENAQHAERLTECGTSALEFGIGSWASYALAVDGPAETARHSQKRAHELPVEVTAWGAFEGAEELSSFALAPRGALPTRTRRASARRGGGTPKRRSEACLCGCGQRVPLGRDCYASDRCAARQRKRDSRRQTSGESATASPAKTPRLRRSPLKQLGRCPRAGSGQSREASDVREAAAAAVDWEGPHAAKAVVRAAARLLCPEVIGVTEQVLGRAVARRVRDVLASGVWP